MKRLLVAAMGSAMVLTSASMAWARGDGWQFPASLPVRVTWRMVAARAVPPARMVPVRSAVIRPIDRSARVLVLLFTAVGVVIV